jgi:hypothetical protein
MKKLFVSLVFVFMLALGGMSSTAAAASPATEFAAACPGSQFLTFNSWFAGLNCNNNSPDVSKSDTGKNLGLDGIWVIVLNILDDVIQATGYIAVGLIIWGGIKYMKSQGAPDQIASAKDTILEASIGLGIVLASVAIVTFVTGNIKS